MSEIINENELDMMELTDEMLEEIVGGKKIVATGSRDSTVKGISQYFLIRDARCAVRGQRTRHRFIRIAARQFWAR